MCETSHQNEFDRRSMCEVEFFGRCFCNEGAAAFFIVVLHIHKPLLPDRCPREFLYYLVLIVKVRRPIYKSSESAARIRQ